MKCPREHCGGFLIPTDLEEAPYRCITCARRFGLRDRSQWFPYPDTTVRGDTRESSLRSYPGGLHAQRDREDQGRTS